MQHTERNIQGLMGLTADTARLLQHGQECTVPIARLKVGDRILVIWLVQQAQTEAPPSQQFIERFERGSFRIKQLCFYFAFENKPSWKSRANISIFN